MVTHHKISAKQGCAGPSNTGRRPPNQPARPAPTAPAPDQDHRARARPDQDHRARTDPTFDRDFVVTHHKISAKQGCAGQGTSAETTAETTVPRGRRTVS